LIRRLKPTAKDKAQMLQTPGSEPYPLPFTSANGLNDRKFYFNLL
jgi:hypothetical protein